MRRLQFLYELLVKVGSQGISDDTLGLRALGLELGCYLRIWA